MTYALWPELRYCAIVEILNSRQHEIKGFTDFCHFILNWPSKLNVGKFHFAPVQRCVLCALVGKCQMTMCDRVLLK